MAPFEVLTAGFCPALRLDWLCALFGVIWKSVRNLPLGRCLGSGQHFGPGTFLCKTNGSRKMWFCGGMVLWWGFRGIPPAQMNSMVPGTHIIWAGYLPKPPLFNYFRGISSFPGKLQAAPQAIPGGSLFSLVALGASRSLPRQVSKGVLGLREEWWSHNLPYPIVA